MFDDVLKQVEQALDIPYPRRAEVVREIEADLWAQYTALCDEGVSPEQARAAALRDLGLDAANIASLSDIHTPALRRALLRLPEPAREPAEWLAAGLSLIAGIYFITKEVPMIDFIRDGGYAMWVILLVGGSGLLLQARRATAWFVTRDHSARSLARNTATPLYLAAATFLVGITGSASGLRVVMLRYTEGMFGVDTMVCGFIEALAPILLATSLAFFIVVVQAAIGAGLRRMQAPQPL
ncbi:hypothetical protein [Haliangium sp.]|uniref:hypothetical protein n=1 Tax=Haliangium sp. TaxID=2663208 RepID=UPI003D0B81ED